MREEVLVGVGPRRRRVDDVGAGRGGIVGAGIKREIRCLKCEEVEGKGSGLFLGLQYPIGMCVQT